LYYYVHGDKLVYASEIKAIVGVIRELGDMGEVRPKDKVIASYLLKRSHDNTEETFFEGVKRVPAGSYLEWDLKKNSYTVNKFWEIGSLFKKESPLQGDSLIAEFRQLFEDSVRIRLISEVPVGTALSGGLDSSAVVCEIAKEMAKRAKMEKKDKEGDVEQKILGKRQRTFSAVFPGKINNEEEYIDEVIAKTNVENHKIAPKREEMWKDLEKVIYHQDEPMISTGPYAQWKVMELAKKNGVKVLLDGQGADEMLAGYDPYFIVYIKELIRGLKVLGVIREIWASKDRLFSLLKNKSNLKVQELFNINDSYIGSHPGILQGETLEHEETLERVGNKNNNLNNRLLKDIFENSLPALLRYEDRNSMAFSIEARVPFLDYRLVEFVASLPSNYKIRNGWSKWIMREALKDLLPKKIVERRWKVGFTTPEVSWFRESTLEVREILNSASFNSRKYFNHAKIREAFEDFVNGKNDESMVFWRIINLELWLRVFID
ncbi:MAG: asparagine synthetase B, partial [Alphaproteobacteria bacterium]